MITKISCELPLFDMTLHNSDMARNHVKSTHPEYRELEEPGAHDDGDSSCLRQRPVSVHAEAGRIVCR